MRIGSLLFGTALHPRDRAYAATGVILLLLAGGVTGARHLAEPVMVSGMLERAVSEANVGAASRRPVLVVVFRPDDCGALVESMSLFSRASEAGTVDVRGVLLANHPSEDLFRTLRKGARLTFPISVTSPRRGTGLLRTLGYAGTPVVIAMDARLRVTRVAALSGATPHRIAASILREAESASRSPAPSESDFR